MRSTIKAGVCHWNYTLQVYSSSSSTGPPLHCQHAQLHPGQATEETMTAATATEAWRIHTIALPTCAASPRPTGRGDDDCYHRHWEAWIHLLGMRTNGNCYINMPGAGPFTSTKLIIYYIWFLHLALKIQYHFPFYILSFLIIKWIWFFQYTRHLFLSNAPTYGCPCNPIKFAGG
jgi:hypothetical protein